MKSQAVFVEGTGIPGVSGEEYVYRPAAPGAIRAGAAKLAGVVPARPDDGLPPSGGNTGWNSGRPDPEVDMRNPSCDADLMVVSTCFVS